MVELLEDFKKLLASEQKEEAVDYALALIEPLLDNVGFL